MAAQGFPDTGPQKDGTRTLAQWKAAMQEDMSLIRFYIDDIENGGDPLSCINAARKESDRLHEDIRRFGVEVYGLDPSEIKY